MKQKLILLAFLSFWASGFGQCPGGTIMLSSQTDIDEFSTNYPGCNQPVRLTIVSNGITNLNGLSQITGIQEVLTLQSVGNLDNFDGLQNLITIGGDFDLFNSGVINFQGLSSLTTIDGEITISGNVNLVDFTGLNSLTNISGIEASGSSPAFRISFNNSLSSLNGLEGIGDIGTGLIITNNINLVSLNGLNNLTTINGNFYIQENSQIQSLTGINNLISVDGGLTILGNENLESLEGIESLVQINKPLFITANESLTSISALSNLEANSILNTIAVANNIQLPLCNIMAICDNLENPAITFIVENNDTGCNTLVEIEKSCLLNVTGNSFESELKLFPNPVSNMLHIQPSSLLTIQKVRVYSILGEELLFTTEKTVDITNFSSGIYLVEVMTDKGIVVKKIVKN